MRQIIAQKGIRKGDGNEHQTFCEDFAFEKDFEEIHVGAVFDGCSGGIDSHFASALFGKIFQSILGTCDFFGVIPSIAQDQLKEVAIGIMVDFYDKLMEIGYSLNLSKKELESTIILSVYDKQYKNLIVYYFGDGVIVINDEIIKLKNTEYEDPNAPSYIVNATYAEDMSEWDFEDWIKQHKGFIQRENVSNFALFSDGVESFQCRNGSGADTDAIIDFLANNEWNIGNKTVFSKKINLLLSGRGQKNGNPFEKDFKVVNYDDISMVRVYNCQEEENQSEEEQAQSVSQ